MSLLRRLDAAALDILYPEGLICLSCGGPAHGKKLCALCGEALESTRIAEKICPLCGEPAAEDGAPCARCAKGWRIKTRSVWKYQGTAARLVTQLKDQSIAGAGDLLAAGIAEEIRGLCLPPSAAVTWVPMPARRKNVRGIDHGRYLAEHAAKESGLECRQLLERTRDGHTQRGLSAAEREVNLDGAFRCPEQVHGTVVLVDDVMTTGATVRVCADVLMRAGADRVIAVTATRVTE